MIRLFLAAIALMFTAFGLWSLFQPEAMTSSLGVAVSGPNGTFEMRGVYGGVSLGGAFLCLGGALRADMARSALWFVAAYMGGSCLARAASVALGDLPTQSTWAFVGFEAASFVLAILALRAQTAR